MSSRPSLFGHMLRTPAWKWGLMLEAAFWLTAARAALLFVPFPRLARYIGTMQKPSEQLLNGSDELATRVRRIGGSVNAVADRFPADMVCLPRALAAWQMLHRRGIASRLHFGKPLTPISGSGMQSHAWLTSSGVRVTGFPVADQCVEIGYFARSENAGPSRLS